MTRSIKIFNTQSSAKSNIESDAIVWGDLVRELESNGISTSGLKAVVGETEVTLESDGAQLPQSEFTLFMMPSKVRSGFDATWDEDPSDDWMTNEENNDDEEENEGGNTPSFTKEELIANLQYIQNLCVGITNVINATLTGVRRLNANLDPETRQLMDQADELAKKLFR